MKKKLIAATLVLTAAATDCSKPRTREQETAEYATKVRRQQERKHQRWEERQPEKLARETEEAFLKHEEEETHKIFNFDDEVKANNHRDTILTEGQLAAYNGILDVYDAVRGLLEKLSKRIDAKKWGARDRMNYDRFTYRLMLDGMDDASRTAVQGKLLAHLAHSGPKAISAIAAVLLHSPDTKDILFVCDGKNITFAELLEKNGHGLEMSAVEEQKKIIDKLDLQASKSR